MSGIKPSDSIEFYPAPLPESPPPPKKLHCHPQTIRIALAIFGGLVIGGIVFLATKSFAITIPIAIPVTLIFILFTICVARRAKLQQQAVHVDTWMYSREQEQKNLSAACNTYWKYWWDCLCPGFNPKDSDEANNKLLKTLPQTEVDTLLARLLELQKTGKKFTLDLSNPTFLKPEPDQAI